MKLRKTLVDIVLVNWNSGSLLKNCIDSLRVHEDVENFNIIVVDNGSVDGSGQIDLSGLESRLVEVGKNIGFAAACNLGVSLGLSEFILFLNPDTALLESSISKAIEFLNHADNSVYGICGIRLVDDTGETQKHCVRFPSPLNFCARSVGVDSLIPALLQPMLMTDFDHLNSRPVDHVIGAFYVIRRTVFEQVSGFDEKFFVYLEDLDLSLRVRQLGKRCYYLAATKAYHKGGGTSEQVKAHRLFYSLRSKIIFSRKHFSVSGWLLVFAVTITVEVLARLVRDIISRSATNAFETLYAYWMLFKDLKNVMSVRF